MNPQQLENLTPDQIKDLYQALQERRGASKHTIFISEPEGLKFSRYSMTKPRPWVLLEKRRAKAKRAKQARKINR